MALICTAKDIAGGIPGLTGCIGADLAENLVNVITIVSVVAAGGFGLLGLLTSYKDDAGRITSWGRVAAGGIVFTALLSVISRTFEGNIAAIKAEQAAARELSVQKLDEADRKAATTRFEEQVKLVDRVLSGVDEVSGRTERVRAGVQTTLLGQRDQLETARQTSIALERSARASQASANRLLKSIWTSAEKVTGRDLTITAWISCYADLEGTPVNETILSSIFGATPTVFVKLLEVNRSSESDRCNKYDATCFGRRVVFDADDPDRAQPTAPTVRLESTKIPNSTVTLEGRVFTNFVVREQSAPALLRSDWNGKLLHIGFETDLSASTAELLRLLAAKMLQNNPIMDAARDGSITVEIAAGLSGWQRAELEVLAKRASTVKLQRNESLLPCTIFASVFIRDKQVANEMGRLVLVEDNRVGRESIDFRLPLLQLEPNLFPTYGQSVN